MSPWVYSVLSHTESSSMGWAPLLEPMFHKWKALFFLCLLFKMGIQDISEEDVSSHQSYSRKTLIALLISGILLAILITTCYFLMNRRSWSPTGERLVSSGLQGKENEEARSPGEVHECHRRGGEIAEEVLRCSHTGMCVHTHHCICG